MVDDSILNNIKKMLGFDPDYSAFDTDITIHINSVFFSLTQLGIGPQQGFSIIGSEETWASFIGSEQIQAVKSYMYLRVRLLFDPPASSFAITSMKEQAEKLEWMLNTQQEGVRWAQQQLTNSLLTSG